MQGHPPSVDVVIAAWSAEETIARAVKSALAQPQVAKVIVVDDASPDNTVAAAESCDEGDGRLVILRQSANAGPAAARNRAIEASESDWIAILDGDDFMLPGRIGRLLEAASDDLDLIADDLLVVDEGAEHAPPRPMLGTAHLHDGMIDLVTFVRGNIAHNNVERAELGFIKPLIRRSFLASQCLRYRHELRLGEDYELYARALGLGARLRIIPPQGYIYVQRLGSLSGTHSETDLLRLREADAGLLADLRLTQEQREALWEHYRSIDCRLQWRRVISGFKSRQALQVLSAFTRSAPVSAYLVARLWEQVRLRTGRRFGAVA